MGQFNASTNAVAWEVSRPMIPMRLPVAFLFDANEVSGCNRLKPIPVMVDVLMNFLLCRECFIARVLMQAFYFD